jgi:hypothetical protein
MKVSENLKNITSGVHENFHSDLQNLRWNLQNLRWNLQNLRGDLQNLHSHLQSTVFDVNQIATIRILNNILYTFWDPPPFQQSTRFAEIVLRVLLQSTQMWGKIQLSAVDRIRPPPKDQL